MAKTKTQFVCQNCGAISPKWQGRCFHCGEWDTLVEEVSEPASASAHRARYPSLADEAGRTPDTDKNKPQSIDNVSSDDVQRLVTGIDELDRVLGNGVTIGSSVLIGGEPGIGKSTLLLQAMSALAKRIGPVLYVTCEESVRQTKSRAMRLGAEQKNLFVLSETNTDTIISHIRQVKPAAIVIDSIQMVYRPDLTSAPGTVSQVRECATLFAYLAKQVSAPVFMSGHITKDGAIAGPKVLEHIVDTVLYFEGDRYHQFRILRAVKNRFGSTNEIGLFEMTAEGLKEVKDPSAIFLSSRDGKKMDCGSAIVSALEGSRALLLEIQALVTRCNFGLPRRQVTGVDPQRAGMILAVLEKRCGLVLGTQDVFLNVVGGVRVEEPAADLGIAVAVASSLKEKPAPFGVAFIGEVGLQGEIRPVSSADVRLREAKKLGFGKAVIPADSRQNVYIDGLEIIAVRTLDEALDLLKV